MGYDMHMTASTNGPTMTDETAAANLELRIIKVIDAKFAEYFDRVVPRELFEERSKRHASELEAAVAVSKADRDGLRVTVKQVQDDFDALKCEIDSLKKAVWQAVGAAAVISPVAMFIVQMAIRRFFE